MLSKFLSITIGALLLATPSYGEDTAELALARKVLSKLQGPSFEANVEYCGYIGTDRDGNLRASPAARGDQDSCLSVTPKHILVITASYHTHAGYSEGYFGELPSGIDVEGDEQQGIDGYVATPGGRLWYIDTTDMVISEICGIACLPKDPNFIPGTDGKIARSYTYDQLIQQLN